MRLDRAYAERPSLSISPAAESTSIPEAPIGVARLAQPVARHHVPARITLDPISQDAACFYEDHVVITEEAGAVTVERDAGKAVAAALKGVKAAIHRNHGLLTVSRHSIESAAFWFIALERCCQQQLMIEATDRQPVLVSPERARYSREHVGSEYIGWLHFQPVYDRIAQTNPDMFD